MLKVHAKLLWNANNGVHRFVICATDILFIVTVTQCDRIAETSQLFWKVIYVFLENERQRR